MCFIKNLNKLQSLENLVPFLRHHAKIKQFQSSETETIEFQDQRKNDLILKNVIQNQYQDLLLKLMTSSLSRNSQSMNFINKQMSECQQKIDNLFHEFEFSQNEDSDLQILHKDHLTELSIAQNATSMSQQVSQNDLTNQIFGNKTYKHRLTLEGQFPDVVYKQRNIKVNILLTNLNGKTIKNSNVVNLCFALADDNGNWINLNRVGDPMLKGKTQVELYHGSAEFNKIYTKDISRTFPNGKVNIVIYAKPSILIYDGLTSEYEEHVDQNSIQPLIISDVMIKAKKKY